MSAASPVGATTAVEAATTAETTAVKAAAAAKPTETSMPKTAATGTPYKSASADARPIVGLVTRPKVMRKAAEVPEVGGAVNEPG